MSLDARFTDEDLREDATRWQDFGFFFQNCREYLGSLDIGITPKLLAKAEDVARRLQNLARVFDGAGVDLGSRVGRVIDIWQRMQCQIVYAPDNATPRADGSYVSKLLPPAAAAEATEGGSAADAPAADAPASSPAPAPAAVESATGDAAAAAAPEPRKRRRFE